MRVSVHAQACSRSITAFSSGKPGLACRISWEELPARGPANSVSTVFLHGTGSLSSHKTRESLHRAVRGKGCGATEVSG